MNAPQLSLDYCPMRRRTVLNQTGPARLVLFESESGASYAVDEVGAMVWGLCDGAHSVSEIVTELGEEYDASLDVIETDVLELLLVLGDKKLLLVKAA